MFKLNSEEVCAYYIHYAVCAIHNYNYNMLSKLGSVLCTPVVECKVEMVMIIKVCPDNQ